MMPGQMKIPSTVRAKVIWIPKSLTRKLQHIKSKAMKTMRVTRKEMRAHLMIIVKILFCKKKKQR